MAAMSDAVAASEKQWFGHPRGLATLFFTEMWERFSYYGMRALLILYMVGSTQQPGLGFGEKRAATIYGLYTMLVYLMGIPGGFIADKFLGHYRAVLVGGIIIALGHFSMAISGLPFFFAGLILIILGTGLLKPNVSTIVGTLYSRDDDRRDAGFSVFYMGINLGAFIAPLITGYLGQKINWHIGFGAAGVGMTIGIIQYVAGRKYLVARSEAKTPQTEAVETIVEEKPPLTGDDWLRMGAIVMLSLPFALVGGVWLMWLLGYNMSVAVAIGFIALAGVASETGVIMLIYLDHAYHERVEQGLLRDRSDVDAAVEHGAVERVRSGALLRLHDAPVVDARYARPRAVQDSPRCRMARGRSAVEHALGEALKRRFLLVLAQRVAGDQRARVRRCFGPLDTHRERVVVDVDQFAQQRSPPVRIVRLAAEFVLLRWEAIRVDEVPIARAALIRRDVGRELEPAERFRVVIDEVAVALVAIEQGPPHRLVLAPMVGEQVGEQRAGRTFRRPREQRALQIVTFRFSFELVLGRRFGVALRAERDLAPISCLCLCAQLQQPLMEALRRDAILLVIADDVVLAREVAVEQILLERDD